jgi:hypothetical protein
MKGRHLGGVLGAALAVGLLVAGCGGNGSGSSNRVTVTGTANFPEANGGEEVADSPFIIIDPDHQDDPLSEAITTPDGRYYGIVRKSTSIAVVITGTVGNDDIRVSGLIATSSNSTDKNLNGQTDIACEAGVSAVADGAISGDDLDAQRIAILEEAAAQFVDDTDFTDPASVTAAALQVRAATNNGEHPAP